LLAGRDVFISGNPHEATTACNGTCPGAGPASIQTLAGVIAAHEQFQTSGNPNLFGITFSEDAIECGQVMNQAGTGIVLNGDPNIYYDCQHPPNPWDHSGPPDRTRWLEIE
jgi:hypothetical protein